MIHMDYIKGEQGDFSSDGDIWSRWRAWFAVPSNIFRRWDSVNQFYSFMEDFIAFLELIRPRHKFCFTMDNLNVHKHPIFIDLIKNAGHCIVFCAPYWSCGGATEYVFNTLHKMMQMDAFNGARSVNELILKIDDKIHLMVLSSFRLYFVNVGFAP